MNRKPAARLLSDVGEKALINDFIKPLFNSDDDPSGVGDDCAMVAFGEEIALISTDRIPSDLIPFRLGIIDYCGLGDYLARLNLSDIAACGGAPLGLLLNLGLPPNVLYDDVQSICRGFQAAGRRHGVKVLGGDITSARELSLSATAIGKSTRNKVLTRRGAQPGDSIFLSRPLGMSPAALATFLLDLDLSAEKCNTLRRQFTDMEPMFALGQALVASGCCSACMDNTDGIGQSLDELSEASKVAFVIQETSLPIPAVVEAVSREAGMKALNLVFNAGADFSLVGTLNGEWSSNRATAELGFPLEIIGRAESGTAVWIENGPRTPLAFEGWNYFQSQFTRKRQAISAEQSRDEA